jgi:hypothetical protein
VLALVVGFITMNGSPVDANINVTDSVNGKQYGSYHSNASSGKYLIALKPGNTYKVAIEVEGADPYFEYVNVKSLDTYVQVTKDYNFVSQPGDSTAKAKPIVADSSDVLQKKLDTQIQQIRSEQNDQVYEQRVYKQVLKKFGSEYDSTVSYVVELGTYQNPADFDSAAVAHLGAIKLERTPEGYYRYSVGPFKTMLDAELYRSRIHAADSTVAKNSEVLVYQNGRRETIPSFYRSEYKRKNYVPRENTAVVMSRQGTLVTTTGANYGYDQLVEDKGTFEADGLEYKLEIATVTDTTDFRLGQFAKYGRIEKKTYPDGTTRYYLGPWKTLKEADDFRNSLMAQDSAAAQSLVTVFYFGQRKTVPEFFADTANLPIAKTQPKVTTPVVNETPKTDTTKVTTPVVVETPKTDTAKVTTPVVVETPKTDTAKVVQPKVTDPVVVETPKVDTTKRIEPKVTDPVVVETPKVDTTKRVEPKVTDPVVVETPKVDTAKRVEPKVTDPVVVSDDPCNSGPVDLAWFRGKSLNDPQVYSKFLDLTGNYCAQGLIYTVQIGAYRKPQNFKYPQLSEFGPANIKEYPDSITRFTLKEFKTIAEAEAFRQVCIKRGIKDAWITAIYKGERRTLEELIANNFYGKAIQ